MRRILAAILMVAMLLTLVACGGKGSIVGKWAFGVNTYEFKDDNTVNVSINGTLNYEGTYEVAEDTIILKVSGLMGEMTKELTYELKGKTLKLTGDVTLSNGVSSTLEFTRQ